MQTMNSEPEYYVLPYVIKEARLKAGLSQKAASELIGYSARAWQSWELGTRKCKPIVLEYFLTKTKK